MARLVRDLIATAVDDERYQNAPGRTNASGYPLGNGILAQRQRMVGGPVGMSGAMQQQYYMDPYMSRHERRAERHMARDVRRELKHEAKAERRAALINDVGMLFSPRSGMSQSQSQPSSSQQYMRQPPVQQQSQTQPRREYAPPTSPPSMRRPQQQQQQPVYRDRGSVSDDEEYDAPELPPSYEEVAGVRGHTNTREKKR